MERAYGKSLQGIVSELVTQPLSMRDTAFGVVDAARLAVPYVDGTPPARMTDPQIVSYGDGAGISMTPAGTIVVMTKKPALGTVKTRLASLSDDARLRLYAAFLADKIDQVRRVSDARVVVGPECDAITAGWVKMPMRRDGSSSIDEAAAG